MYWSSGETCDSVCANGVEVAAKAFTSARFWGRQKAILALAQERTLCATEEQGAALWHPESWSAVGGRRKRCCQGHFGRPNAAAAGLANASLAAFVTAYSSSETRRRRR
jgi:hypothetical protein